LAENLLDVLAAGCPVFLGFLLPAAAGGRFRARHAHPRGVGHALLRAFGANCDYVGGGRNRCVSICPVSCEFCVAGGAGETAAAAVLGVVVEPGKDAVEHAVREEGLELDRHAGGAEVEPAGIRTVVVAVVDVEVQILAALKELKASQAAL